MVKIGVVFSNLGTPQSPMAKDVGSYLNEFLMDPYVIQVPVILRWLLVKGIIVPFRSKKSAANYQKVWTKRGSPLKVETEKAAFALQERLGPEYQVVVAMRYGEPSFQAARVALEGCQQVIFFPQYPQFAESTVQTGLDEFLKHFADKDIKVIPPYFEDPDYIKAHARFLKARLKDLDYQHLLMSFHGLPESHIERTDPTAGHCLKSKDCCAGAPLEVLKRCYRAQCFRSARLIAEEMGLKDDQYSVSFQSRLGRQKWIEPYTEDMYQNLLNQGVRRLAVTCPGFSVDGLETLEEISMGGRETFLEKGGEAFHFVPCLNSDSGWIEACVKLLEKA